ncbi:signal peptidase I [Caulobacter sp. S45]|uniref:signal peptidase I n=1 Tax=Caulobacter sp. S45 TaxID=1641861 RepID=UPI0020B12251|nr:signal peptidase I [Caulobacter sp. S45]
MPNKSGSGAAQEVFELGKTIFYALLIAFVLRVVLFQPFTIPSESMEPTLLKGDYLIVSKFAYGWSRHSIPFNPPLAQGRLLGHSPKRGDIIVFKLPRDGKTDYIKRLIGLPGDRIQVTHGHLQINGQPVQREMQPPSQEDDAGSASIASFKETLPGGKTFTTNSFGPDGLADNTGVYTVPQGCFFMMGDNRDNSLDSRFDPGDAPPGQASCPWNHDVDKFMPSDLGVGFVPAEDLVGRADIILFSWRPGVSVIKPWTWFTTARWNRFFHLLG